MIRQQQSNQRLRIVIVSGGTGRTAEQVVQAALAQFPHQAVNLEYQTRIRSVEKVAEIVQNAALSHSVIFHSFVDPNTRRAVNVESRRLGVICVDVLGPALTLIGDHLQSAPRGRAGLLYELYHEQLDRVDAMDFTLAHDDGKRIDELKSADVVLVGASRTSKSVTCFYLAFRGFRAANVPLIPGQRPPRELGRLSPRRVIGLTMNAAHLESIRQSRLDRITNRSVPNYADLRAIQAELREVRNSMSERDWQCIDVSYKATEEVASQIIELLPRKRTRKKRSGRKTGPAASE